MADRYHCAVIGGGLSGLCLAIQLAGKGYRVVLFEKNKYPFHKVCGEYISMESWDFLTAIGLPLESLSLPVITQLGVSSQQGFMLNHPLGMGGFGISRFTLDHLLSQRAREAGVEVYENCKVTDVKTAENGSATIVTSVGTFAADIVCGSYGKYTPSFVGHDADSPETGAREGANYIGVKYHIQTDLAPDRIELHNFKDGYCGISRVDRDWYCLCYLTTAKNLLAHKKDIHKMEENVLYSNPHLRRYFMSSDFVSRDPLVISNVYFGKKRTSTPDMLLLGDAAGSITPLCGNGMSMGMRASRILASELVAFFEGQQGREDLLNHYHKAWNSAFTTRITAGYYLQNLFGKTLATHYALKFLDHFPSVTSRLIALTHGEKF